MAGPREQSMEDILASIKRVIAEEKEIRATANVVPADDHHDDVLELDELVEEEVSIAVDLGPPLMEERAADSSRQRLEQLASVAATAPATSGNPLEDMVREMMRPMLKQWLDENLPRIVDEHVKREIHRITGKPV